MEVTVTQYKFPDGHRVDQQTTISDECAQFYKRMLRRGLNLAAECRDGQVTLYIEDRQRGKDLACEIVPNGPTVQRAIEKMLRETFAEVQHGKQE